MTEVFLDSFKLWPTLRKLAQETKGRRYVATPYLGADASKLLPLRRGDVLICALTLANARAGNVYPSEVRALLRKGVQVFVQGDLHAKVYLLGRAAVVCSANLSRHSLDVLDEAGVVLRERGQVAEVREWFARRLGEPVQSEWLVRCEEEFRPPRTGGSKKGRSLLDRPSMVRPGLWLVRAKPAKFPEDEARDAAEGARQAKQNLKKPNLSQVYELRWVGKARFVDESAAGDPVIVLYEEKRDKVRVRPNGKLLGKRRVRTRRGGWVTYCYLEMPRKFRTLSFEAFARACSTVGFQLNLRRLGGVRERKVVQEMLLQTSPERLRLA